MCLQSVNSSNFVCENKNNGDKFYRRKSMRAADEKLIINKLGPKFKLMLPGSFLIA